MNAQDIIKQIKAIINEPDEEENSQGRLIHSFFNKKAINQKAHTGKNRITLMGDDKVIRYLAAFNKLYKEMRIESKLMSVTAFQITCEQEMFENKFNEHDIFKILEETKIEPFTNVAIVYGLTLGIESKQLGKYTIVCKENISSYVKDAIEKEKINFDYDLLDNQLSHDEKDRYDFVYLVYVTEARDKIFAHYLFEQEKQKFIRIIRYMVGYKDERLYIDYVRNESFLTPRLQISKKDVTFGAGLTSKDMTINLDAPTFTSDKNGNSKIWQITQEKQPNKMQDRILKSIYWVGISIAETNSEIAITELSIAFESLLKQNENNGPITSSIQRQIAEAVAFIIGKTVIERKEIVSKFNIFYGYRSAIVHGGTKKDNNIDYYYYLKMLKSTLKTILSDSPFTNCQNIEELIEIIETIKYS